MTIHLIEHTKKLFSTDKFKSTDINEIYWELEDTWKHHSKSFNRNDYAYSKPDQFGNFIVTDNYGTSKLVSKNTIVTL